MSRSISISGHVKLTDRQEQVVEHTWTFKEPLERCQKASKVSVIYEKQTLPQIKTGQNTEQNMESTFFTAIT